MNQFGASVRREPAKHLIAIIAITDTCADFDQFMIAEGLPEFADYALGQAALADEDERVQGMAESPQVFFLAFRECHVPIIEPHARTCS
jgi:hypothetical protein